MLINDHCLHILKIRNNLTHVNKHSVIDILDKARQTNIIIQSSNHKTHICVVLTLYQKVRSIIRLYSNVFDEFL